MSMLLPGILSWKRQSNFSWPGGEIYFPTDGGDPATGYNTHIEAAAYSEPEDSPPGYIWPKILEGTFPGQIAFDSNYMYAVYDAVSADYRVSVYKVSLATGIMEQVYAYLPPGFVPKPWPKMYLSTTNNKAYLSYTVFDTTNVMYRSVLCLTNSTYYPSTEYDGHAVFTDIKEIDGYLCLTSASPQYVELRSVATGELVNSSVLSGVKVNNIKALLPKTSGYASKVTYSNGSALVSTITIPGLTTVSGATISSYTPGAIAISNDGAKIYVYNAGSTSPYVEAWVRAYNISDNTLIGDIIGPFPPGSWLAPYRIVAANNKIYFAFTDASSTPTGTVIVYEDSPNYTYLGLARGWFYDFTIRPTS